MSIDPIRIPKPHEATEIILNGGDVCSVVSETERQAVDQFKQALSSRQAGSRAGGMFLTLDVQFDQDKLTEHLDPNKMLELRSRIQWGVDKGWSNFLQVLRNLGYTANNTTKERAGSFQRTASISWFPLADPAPGRE
jgi:hypothetical protein